MVVYYRPSITNDPEERLEDAALWKALHDEYGEEVVLLHREDRLPEDGLFFGRLLGNEQGFSCSGNKDMRYWLDPAFLLHAQRPVEYCDIEEAEEAVGRIHADGRDAFLKSAITKHYVGRVPCGTSLNETLGAMVYSFIDRGKILLVQPFCDFRFEQRFLFIDSEIVTWSPVASHLTPLDTGKFDTLTRFYKTPRSKSVSSAPGRYLGSLAEKVARECLYANVCIDCAWIDGKPGVVEFNDFHIGQVGLYACDVRKIARASRKLASRKEKADA